MSAATTSFPTTVWNRVVCGIDYTPASVQAAVLAAQLMPASGHLTLCAVASPDAIEGGTLLEPTLIREADTGLATIQNEVRAFHQADAHFRDGPPVRGLLDELVAQQASLVAVGSHSQSRLAGVMLGSVATAILHQAGSSVLIAHADPPPEGDLIVGFDGSSGARRALDAGRELAHRLSLKLRVIVATGDRPPGQGSPREELGPELELTEDPRTAVEALADSSHSARLLILGSRHLHGVSALSSVSERTAHHARSPVLVVR